MDVTKTAEAPVEEQETEYCYICGGIQPMVIPETEEWEEEEA